MHGPSATSTVAAMARGGPLAGDLAAALATGIALLALQPLVRRRRRP